MTKKLTALCTRHHGADADGFGLRLRLHSRLVLAAGPAAVPGAATGTCSTSPAVPPCSRRWPRSLARSPTPRLPASRAPTSPRATRHTSPSASALPAANRAAPACSHTTTRPTCSGTSPGSTTSRTAQSEPPPTRPSAPASAEHVPLNLRPRPGLFAARPDPPWPDVRVASANDASMFVNWPVGLRSSGSR